jgi:hypothetical protein
MRGRERKEGPPNKERGDSVGDASLQSHSGANLHLKRAKNRGNVAEGGEADGVALTPTTTMVTTKGIAWIFLKELVRLHRVRPRL